MPKLTVLPNADLAPNGAEFEVAPGTSICEALLENGVEIEHACDMSCACTTCHVVVRAGGEFLNPSTEEEDDLLDKAWGLEMQSRLSCQAIMMKHDVTVEIPKYSLNHAKENH